MSTHVSYDEFLRNVSKTRVTRAGLVKIMRENDAIEVSKMDALKSHAYLRHDVTSGTIRLDDIMRAGGRDLKVFNSVVLRNALRQLASGNAKFTAEDISTILSTYSSAYEGNPQMILVIAMKYGTEFALSFKTQREIATAHHMTRCMEDTTSYTEEYEKQVIQYAAALDEIDCQQNGDYATPKFKPEDFPALLDSGIPPHVVIDKKLTIEQVQAVAGNKSIQSIAEGWL